MPFLQNYDFCLADSEILLIFATKSINICPRMKKTNRIDIMMKKIIQWVSAALLVCCIMTPYSCVKVDDPDPIQPSEELTLLRQDNRVSLYTFEYPSVNAKGEPVVLSALLIAWTPGDRQENDSIEAVHVFNHITITADDECPSSEDKPTEQTMISLVPNREYKSYTTGERADYVGRCIIIAPDYEGYGISKNTPHPYLSQRLTAQQVVDAVQCGLKIYRKSTGVNQRLLPIKSDWRMFAIGYSQGGAVTLAVQRYIEENNLAASLHFQGSICGDGPYDLITTIRYYIDDDGTSYGTETKHRKGIVTMPIVMPLIIKGMCYANPLLAPYGIENYLSQQLIDTGVLDWIDSKEYTTSDISQMWYSQLKNGLEKDGRHYTPEQMAEMLVTPEGDVWGCLEKMLTKECYDYLSNPDNFVKVPTKADNAMAAMHIALAENSLTTGWTPKHRIYFMHSKSDTVVPYGNWQSFRDAHADEEGTLFRVDDTFSTGDHVGAGVTFYTSFGFRNTAPAFNWLCESTTKKKF